MRQYRMFQAPIMTFFSPSFYRDVGLHWKGTGFAYLLLLLTICWIPPFIQFHLSVADSVENKAPALTAQIPQISIINGEASADVTQPYKIIDPDSGEVLVLINTASDTVLLEGIEARIILMKTEVIFKKNDVETRTFSLKKIEHFKLNQEIVSGWLTMFRSYSAVVFFPFALLGSFAFRIVQILAYAAIGLLFMKWCKTSKPYKTLIRLSVMAVTPVIIVSTVMGIIDVKIPLQGLFFFIAAMALLFLGVKAVSCQEKKQVTMDKNQSAQQDA